MRLTGPLASPLSAYVVLCTLCKVEREKATPWVRRARLRHRVVGAHSAQHSAGTVRRSAPGPLRAGSAPRRVVRSARNFLFFYSNAKQSAFWPFWSVLGAFWSVFGAPRFQSRWVRARCRAVCPLRALWVSRAHGRAGAQRATTTWARRAAGGRCTMSLHRRMNVSFPKVWRRLRERFTHLLTQTHFRTKSMEIESYARKQPPPRAGC